MNQRSGKTQHAVVAAMAMGHAKTKSLREPLSSSSWNWQVREGATPLPVAKACSTSIQWLLWLWWLLLLLLLLLLLVAAVGCCCWLLLLVLLVLLLLLLLFWTRA